MKPFFSFSFSWLQLSCLPMEPVRRGQPTPKSPSWMGTVSDLLILSGFKREFSKYPKPARRLVSAAILVNVAGRAGSQAGERFTWPEAGDGALGGGDGTAGAPPIHFPGSPATPKPAGAACTCQEDVSVKSREWQVAWRREVACLSSLPEPSL